MTDRSAKAHTLAIRLCRRVVCACLSVYCRTQVASGMSIDSSARSVRSERGRYDVMGESCWAASAQDLSTTWHSSYEVHSPTPGRTSGRKREECHVLERQDLSISCIAMIPPVLRCQRSSQPAARTLAAAARVYPAHPWTVPPLLQSSAPVLIVDSRS